MPAALGNTAQSSTSPSLACRRPVEFCDKLSLWQMRDSLEY